MLVLKFDIVLQEDIKSLTCYIVEKHYDAFEGVIYVQTFKNLKQRYEQHQDRLKDKTNLERSVKRLVPSVLVYFMWIYLLCQGLLHQL